jgi:hypothetical protein
MAVVKLARLAPTLRGQSSRNPMPTEAVILFAALAGSFGSLAVIAVGARCTRNLRTLGWGGVCSGAALGTAAYFSLH